MYYILIVLIDVRRNFPEVYHFYTRRCQSLEYHLLIRMFSLLLSFQPVLNMPLEKRVKPALQVIQSDHPTD